jgi:Holliday junction resolvase-like predicted endonuclease
MSPIGLFDFGIIHTRFLYNWGRVDQPLVYNTTELVFTVAVQRSDNTNIYVLIRDIEEHKTQNVISRFLLGW